MDIDAFLIALLSFIALAVAGILAVLWQRSTGSQQKMVELLEEVDETRARLHEFEDKYRAYKSEVAAEIAVAKAELQKSRAVVRELSYDLAEMGAGITRLMDQIMIAGLDPIWLLPQRLQVKHKQVMQFGVPEKRQPVDLARLINERFNVDELEEFLYELGIDYEALPGEGKWKKIRELVKMVERQRELPELLASLKLARPKFDWPEMP